MCVATPRLSLAGAFALVYTAEMATPKLKVIPTNTERRMQGISDALEGALSEHSTFDSVMIVAVVKNDDGSTKVRVYSSDLNYFERIGLLEDGKDALLRQ